MKDERKDGRQGRRKGRKESSHKRKKEWIEGRIAVKKEREKGK